MPLLEVGALFLHYVPKAPSYLGTYLVPLDFPDDITGVLKRTAIFVTKCRALKVPMLNMPSVFSVSMLN